jgi:hypothetical protein
MLSRTAPASERLFCELTRLYNEASDKEVGLVFGVVVDPKIGTAVAAEIGFTADVFTTEEDALNWLGGLK